LRFEQFPDHWLSYFYGFSQTQLWIYLLEVSATGLFLAFHIRVFDFFLTHMNASVLFFGFLQSKLNFNQRDVLAKTEQEQDAKTMGPDFSAFLCVIISSSRPCCRMLLTW